jgi:hypothetical protein
MTASFKIAALLLTLSAIIYGVIPPLVDLTETHVFHPGWTPHARFHMVWLLAVNSSIAIYVLFLVWWPGGDRSRQMKTAGILGLIALGGFVVSAIFRGAYGGAFTDPVGGVPPIMGIDANLVVFSPALVMQIIALILMFRDGRIS